MKNTKLIIGVLVVAVLVYIGYKTVKGSKSSVETELINFAIKDIENIDRFIITDDFGKMDIRKDKNGKWTDENGNCVSLESVDFVLDAAQKIEFKGYLEEGSTDNFKKIMITRHIKVDYFKNGKLNKTWFIGPPSKDHLGQVMMLQEAGGELSDRPVLMNIKGVYGIIEPRFFGDKRKWQCTNIFSYEPHEIAKVSVDFPLQPARSFSVENIGNHDFKVKQQQVILNNVDTANVMLYLNRFKKIHYDIPNFSLNEKQVDSLKRTSPFCKLNLTLKTGESKIIRMYREQSSEASVNEFGESVSYNTTKFWAVLPSGELVKCQYYAFDPIIQGHIYFPLDLSSIQTGKMVIHSPEHYRKD